MTNVRESVHDLHDASVNMEEAIRGLIEGYQSLSGTIYLRCGKFCAARSEIQFYCHCQRGT
ncbi:MAG: hypothetical protein ACLUUG_13710 [Lachnospiraceae bacterium]